MTPPRPTTMTESVSFKAYLKRDGQEVEVRRFGIDAGAATNFMYLQSKILDMFPSIQNDQFKIFWKDSDNDCISVGSDEELLEALTAANAQPFKLFVNITTEEQNNRGGSAQSKPQTHPGITCDGCEAPVSGFRYKCVTCPDFDLCAACEATGQHPDHFMLRVPWPVGPGVHPKIFRKFFGRPHKFHKFARHCGQAGGFNMRGEATGPSRCPFSRPAGSNAPPTSDMFDFSALMDFITSLETNAAGQSGGANEPTANAQTSTTNTQAPPPPQPNVNRERQPRPVPGAEYLNTIGQAISAFLDPFGIDVTIEENRNRTPGTQEATATSQPSAAAPSASPQPQPTPFTTPQPQSTPLATPQPQSTPLATPQPQPTPSITPQLYPTLPTPSSSSTPPRETATPTPAETVKEVSPPARRNSDDWTLLNRESPTRNEAMDVESAAAVPQAEATPTAPPTPQVDAEAEKKRERLQEAISTLRNMGFKHDTRFLEDTILEENFNLVSVLEKMLNNARKL